MKQRKKNKLLTLFFSFIPGAAEMYMGFMKQGLSLMALMAVSIVGATYSLEFFSVPNVNDIFVNSLVSVIIHLVEVDVTENSVSRGEYHNTLWCKLEAGKIF